MNVDSYAMEHGSAFGTAGVSPAMRASGTVRVIMVLNVPPGGPTDVPSSGPMERDVSSVTGMRQRA